MPKDEYGIEYSEGVEKALKDPKGSLIAEVFDYMTARNKAKAAKEAEELAETEKKKKKDGMFGGLFD